MAKTLNPEIDIFGNYPTALKAFEKSTVSCHLLEATVGGKVTYFLDRRKTALQEWPNLYKLISEK